MRSPDELRTALALVPNEPVRDRFLALARTVGHDRLAVIVARACGWDSSRDGRPEPVRLRVRGVEVALGLKDDKFGARRTLMRAYRVAQFTAAMDAVENTLANPPVAA